MKKNKNDFGLKTKILLSILAIIVFCVALYFKNDVAKFFNLKVDYQSHQVTSEEINDSQFKVAYLNVGQGSCSVIQFPDDKVLVVDGGSTRYGETIYDYLISENIDKIDYLIATHADADHIGGLNYLFDKFEIENIYRPMQVAGTDVSGTGFIVWEDEDLKDEYNLYKSKFVTVDTQTYRTFISNVYNETYTDANGQTKDSNVTVFHKGLSVIKENYSIEFIAPFKASVDLKFNDKTEGFLTKKYTKDSSNSSSAVFVVTICEKTFLFSGDAPAYEDDFKISANYEESDILLNGDTQKIDDIDVYLVAHHGSKYSSSTEFLKLIKPDFCVISVGKNSYGHPTDEAIKRINNLTSMNDDGLLNTQNNGNVIFAEIDGELVYTLQQTEKSSKLTLSIELLLVIILVVVIIFIFNLKIPQKRKGRREI